MIVSVIGTRAREAATRVTAELSNLRGDAEDTLSEVKLAAQTGTITFVLVAMVAVTALLMATAALVRVQRQG